MGTLKAQNDLAKWTVFCLLTGALIGAAIAYMLMRPPSIERERARLQKTRAAMDTAIIALDYYRQAVSNEQANLK